MELSGNLPWNLFIDEVALSDTIWVDVEGRAKADLPADNSIMITMKEELDSLSEQLGTNKLSCFYDYSVLAEEYGDGPEELVEGRWFDALAGLRVVEPLRAFLAEHPELMNFDADSKRSHWRSILSEELERCEVTLRNAASRGQRFRLLIVP
jgi:hypothetical protein